MLFCCPKLKMKFEITSGKVLEETYLKWVQYKDDCIKMIKTEPQPQEGLFCNRTFDSYACWPDSPAGFMVNISCPFYLPWYDKVSQGSVRRQCGAEGLWQRDDSGQVWRDRSEFFFFLFLAINRTLYLRHISEPCLVYHYRKLHCTRNYIHANLFVSFILRAVAVIVKDAMLERHWGREIIKQADVNELLSHQAAIGCRTAQVLMQYCVLANHYCFFGEAVYLYSILVSSIFIDNNKFLPYLCLGWGTPLLFVVPWVVVKILKENKECWAINENMNYWWIIRFPVLFASLVNFLIFLKILGIILSKLRANNQGQYPDYKLRLAKATLTLIPLFGVHEVLFVFATDEQTTGVLRYIKVFFTLFISSFQGLLVAVLYCFANKKVQTELRRKLLSWRTETEILCCGK
uniref:Glucagon receptor-like n=1 Tax=Kryptolebias marmoratus TaxID=37003 RepID=A0A3Q3AJQ3_KRYMA